MDTRSIEDTRTLIRAYVNSVDWTFADSESDFLTHPIHAYPAKFIPQIPSAFISHFTLPGNVILDPFCGSGTTLVEAVRSGRDAVGVDSNPLAALISDVKCRPLSSSGRREVDSAVKAAVELLSAEDAGRNGQTRLFGKPLAVGRPDLEERLRRFPVLSDNLKYVFFWFPEQSIAELLWLRELIQSLSSTDAKEFSLVALSAVVISASYQDSETRYTRRKKKLRPGDVIRRWTAKIREMLTRTQELNRIPTLGSASVYASDARYMQFLPADSIDLCVTSPPYPNAFTYNLYHRVRMVWLGVDPQAVKQVEIGSHRDYSRPRNGSDKYTFLQDMTSVMSELFRVLRSRALCVVVVGDSIVRGEHVDNSTIVNSAATTAGFESVASIQRRIHLGKKALNPLFGKIKFEHLLVLRKP